MAKIVEAIRPGDRVTIVDRFGKQRTGRAVMRSAHGGWVLNMGGKHGTPGIASDENVVGVRPTKRPGAKRGLGAARAKRMTCEGGYWKAEAEDNAASLRKRGYEVKIKATRTRRGIAEYAVCWRRK